jgi:AcrR family transcriptional regulator
MVVRKSTEERQVEIANAAIRIIGDRGLRDFTMARLAEEVGIKDGSIFRHFKDKQAILNAVVERIEEILVVKAPGEIEDPLERLEAFLTTRMRAVASQPGLLSIVFSDQLTHAMGDEGRRRVAELRNRGRAFLRSCLEEAIEKQLINSETDVESAALLINGMVMSLLFASKDGAIEGPIDQAGRRAWRTFAQLLRR